MPLHLGIPHSDAHERAREARRILQSKVRNDWNFPASVNDFDSSRRNDGPGESANSTNEEGTVDDNHDDEQAHAAASAAVVDTLDFEPVAWREQEYGSSESYASEYTASEAMDTEREEFKFESPDSVQETLAEKKARRKKTRRQRREEEMAWNAGLAHFVARRNAWTCAKEVATGDEAGSEDARSQSKRTMLPVPPVLLPDHPTRARINSSTYPMIYSEIILQSRTPTVPVNLSHISKALVNGWKQEGNWPPKATMPELPLGRRKVKDNNSNGDSPKHPHLRKGVQAVTRALGLGLSNGHNATNEHKEQG